MFHDFKIEEGDPATNSVMATVTTRLSEAEEANWRSMLAEAWSVGHSAHGPVREFGETPCTCVNPFVSHAD